MKNTTEMGSGAMIYISGFIKIVSAIQKFMGGGHKDTQTAWKSHKSAFILFKIRKVG
jgi:hypothetical protein